MAVLPRLELAAGDVVVTHAAAKSSAAQAAKEAWWPAATAERTKLTRFRKDVPDPDIPVCIVCSGAVRVHGQGGGVFRELSGDIAVDIVIGAIHKDSCKRGKGKSQCGRPSQRLRSCPPV